MRNVKTSKKGSVLVIEVETDPSKAQPWESSSGKSLNVASTEGNVTCTEFPELKLGINIYKSNPNRPTKSAK
jgi:hypothetical protein